MGRTVFIVLSIVGYLCFSSIAACYVRDLHLLNAMGATLAAIAALAVIWQVKLEQGAEELNRADAEIVNLITADAVVREVGLKAVFDRRQSRYRERMRLVTMLAALTFTAEVVHGWGDRGLALICPIDHVAAPAGH